MCCVREPIKGRKTWNQLISIHFLRALSRFWHHFSAFFSCMLLLSTPPRLAHVAFQLSCSYYRTFPFWFDFFRVFGLLWRSSLRQILITVWQNGLLFYRAANRPKIGRSPKWFSNCALSKKKNPVMCVRARKRSQAKPPGCVSFAYLLSSVHSKLVALEECFQQALNLKSKKDEVVQLTDWNTNAAVTSRACIWCCMCDGSI